MRLSFDELATGALIGLGTGLLIKWWSFLLAPAIGILWAMGGSSDSPEFFGLSSRHWRRLGVPLVLCGACSIITSAWLPLLSVLPIFGVCTLGYGIPDATDEGSMLGRFFFFGIAKENEIVAQFYTRVAIGLLLGIAMLPIAFISWGTWLMFLGFTTILTPVAVQIFEGEVTI